MKKSMHQNGQKIDILSVRACMRFPPTPTSPCIFGRSRNWSPKVLLLKSAMKSHILEGFCTIERLKKWSILGRLDGRCAVDSQIPTVELLFFFAKSCQVRNGSGASSTCATSGWSPYTKGRKA